MGGDAHSCAKGVQGTTTAPGGDRRAQILAVGHQQIVQDDPVTMGQFHPQGQFGLIRRLRFDIAPPVADPVDVGIDADSRFLERKGDNEVRGLPPYSF